MAGGFRKITKIWKISSTRFVETVSLPKIIERKIIKQDSERAH
jgi:hypothetical protein